MRKLTKAIIFIIGLMISWTLGGCSTSGSSPGPASTHTLRAATSSASSTSETVTVRGIYESPLGNHLYRIDRPGQASLFAQPIYRSPIDGTTVWRVD